VDYAQQAHEWLVAATDSTDGSLALFRVLPTNLGVDAYPMRLMDGRPAADLVFNECRLNSDALLAGPRSAEEVLEEALCRGAAAYCAEALGIMGSLMSHTGEYLRTRVQFGAALATFQALQHRFADMYIAYKESFAMVRHAMQHLCGTDRAEQARAMLAMREVITASARRIGHEAIQMHGAIGATDELPVSHCNSRLVAIQRALVGREGVREKLAMYAHEGA
jgi:alkylation response protein AidB-like acyl-CoA dehydrogenase